MPAYSSNEAQLSWWFYACSSPMSLRASVSDCSSCCILRIASFRTTFGSSSCIRIFRTFYVSYASNSWLCLRLELSYLLTLDVRDTVSFSIYARDPGFFRVTSITSLRGVSSSEFSIISSSTGSRGFNNFCIILCDSLSSINSSSWSHSSSTSS